MFETLLAWFMIAGICIIWAVQAASKTSAGKAVGQGLLASFLKSLK